jgi:signal transduction histidine kinase
VLAYGALWVFTDVGAIAPRHRPPRRSAQQAVALGLIVLGLLLLLRQARALVRRRVGVAGRAGSARLGDRLGAQRRRRPPPVVAGGRPAPPRPAAGGRRPPGVAGPRRRRDGARRGGVGGFLAANEGLRALSDLGLAVLAALGGFLLLFGPWLWRLVEQLGTERRERIRHEERAELAAHLHDSVLQTLALIQRSSDQPRRMVALARRQERELRSWLYGQDGGGQLTLGEAVEEVAEEVEAIHDLSVEVVVVGDATVDDRLRALLAATGRRA